MFINRLFFLLEGSFAKPCTETPADPVTFAVYPISDSQAIAVWDKPMGGDIAFQLTFRLDAALRFKLIEGLQSYGPMDMALLAGLEPNTKYHAELRFYCGKNSLLETEWVKIKFTTLQKGRLSQKLLILIF